MNDASLIDTSLATIPMHTELGRRLFLVNRVSEWSSAIDDSDQP